MCKTGVIQGLGKILPPLTRSPDESFKRLPAFHRDWVGNELLEQRGCNFWAANLLLGARLRCNFHNKEGDEDEKKNAGKVGRPSGEHNNSRVEVNETQLPATQACQVAIIVFRRRRKTPG